MLQIGVENLHPWMIGPLQVAIDASGGIGGSVCIPWAVLIPASGSIVGGYVWFIRQREAQYRELLNEVRSQIRKEGTA